MKRFHWLIHGVWGIKSNMLIGNVIIHVLFSATVIVLVPVH